MDVLTCALAHGKYERHRIEMVDTTGNEGKYRHLYLSFMAHIFVRMSHNEDTHHYSIYHAELQKKCTLSNSTHICIRAHSMMCISTCALDLFIGCAHNNNQWALFTLCRS